MPRLLPRQATKAAEDQIVLLLAQAAGLNVRGHGYKEKVAMALGIQHGFLLAFYPECRVDMEITMPDGKSSTPGLWFAAMQTHAQKVRGGGTPDGILRQGTLNCPKCREKLHWKGIAGMTLRTHVRGIPVYEARCPKGCGDWNVKA